MIPNEESSKDMIKTILQKIIDEMNTMESDRIMPESRKPKAVEVEIAATSAKPEEIVEEDEEGLDPAVLSDLMAKAGDADETGALPDDVDSDLPPEISEAVRRKREKNVLPTE